MAPTISTGRPKGTASRASAVDETPSHVAPPSIAAAISDRYGARIDVAVIDANDLTSEVFAITDGLSVATLRGLVSDNPLGQSAEQTPFGLIRRLTDHVDVPSAAVTA